MTGYYMKKIKEALKKADGFERVAYFALSAWIVIANFIYFHGVNDSRHFSMIDFSRNDNFPVWQVCWSYITFNLDVARLYDITHSEWQNGASYSTDEYRFLGHLLWNVMPLILIWAAYKSIRWIAGGFSK